jgi:hypothetical protein
LSLSARTPHAVGSTLGAGVTVGAGVCVGAGEGLVCQ